MADPNDRSKNVGLDRTVIRPLVLIASLTRASLPHIAGLLARSLLAHVLLSEAPMKTLVVIATAVVGGVMALRALPRVPHYRLTAAVSRRMVQRMERMMASLPEGSPPKLIMSVLPRLRDQNDQIIAMLREQHELLRELRRTTH